MKKTVLISDFDGTISKADFFHMVIDRLLKKEDIKPWNDYLEKKITHVEALARIFAKVRLSREEMDDFIQTIEIDEYVPQTFELCKQLDIPIYICSAGMDYYILKRIPDLIEKYNITVIANRAQYSQETGFDMRRLPEDSPFYNYEIGVSKEGLVEHLKKQGFYVIFAGDGRPDIKAAKIADTVFAKDMLLELCKEKNIKTLVFNDFSNIIQFINDRYEIK